MYDPVGVADVVEIERVLVKVGLPLVGFTLAVSPVAVGEMEVVRLTDCVVPLTRDTVTVEVVPRESVLEPVKVRVAVPVPPDATVIVVELKLSVTPFTDVAERVMVPLNPFRLVTEIVVEVDPSLDIVRLDGEALMLKSGVAGVVTVNAYDAL